jgi:hypothetical protein
MRPAPGRGADYDWMVGRWCRRGDPQPPATRFQASGLGGAEYAPAK